MVEYQVQMHVIDGAGAEQRMCPKNYVDDVRTGILSSGSLVLPGSDKNETMKTTMANIRKYLNNLSDVAQVLRTVSDDDKDPSTVNIPSTVVTTLLSERADALDKKCADLQAYADTKAPIMHADAALTYGGGTASKYGHVRLSDVYSTKQANSAAEHSIGASQNALNAAWADLENRKADNNHADSGTKYGHGTASLYGHVKTTNTYNSTNSDAAVVATQKAVYDMWKELSDKNTSQDTAINGKAKTNHADSGTGYGVGTTTLFGHLKVNDNYNDASQETGGKAANGVASSSWALKRAYDALSTLIDGKLANSHKDEKATGSKFSHVKLTDAYTTNQGAASTGVGASSKALFDAYTAVTTLTTGLQNSINTINSTINDMKTSFQDGVNTIYNAIVNQGVTPANKTPGTLSTSIGTVATNKYNAGVTAADGRTNVNSANYQAGYNKGLSDAHTEGKVFNNTQVFGYSCTCNKGDLIAVATSGDGLSWELTNVTQMWHGVFSRSTMTLYRVNSNGTCALTFTAGSNYSWVCVRIY